MRCSLSLLLAASIAAAVLAATPLRAQAPASTIAALEARVKALEAQNAKLQAELRQKRGQKNKVPVPAQVTLSPAGVPSDARPMSAWDIYRANIEAGKIRELRIRKSPFEAFGALFPFAPDNAAAGGASASFTNDNVGHSRQLKLDAFISYNILPRLPATSGGRSDDAFQITSHTLSPFVYATGALNDPRKGGDRNALQLGIDAEALAQGGPLPEMTSQTFRLAPYFQTDFRGVARIYGLTANWEPYIPALNLGRAKHPFGYERLVDGKLERGSLLTYYWRLVPEVNVFRVSEAGDSAYASKRDYAFLGGTAQLNVFPFENMTGVPPWLCGRTSLSASYAYFWEAVDRKFYRDFQAAASYDLTPEADRQSKYCEGVEAMAKGQRSKVMATFTYAHGTEKATLEYRNLYKVGLTFTY